MKLLIVIGTRPNFIKVTQFKRVARAFENIEIEIVHTGQHYDRTMAGVFFEQFGLSPDHFLTLRGAKSAEQFGHMIADLGNLISRTKPNAVMVPGDVNSTLAGALAANRCGLPVFHLEAGLRSFDRNMPEEVNRILVDQLADKYFVTEKSGLDHLRTEGLDMKSGVNEAHFVGNTMIDTIVAFDERIQSDGIMKKLRVNTGSFILMTMHRPSNVDNLHGLQFIVDVIRELTMKKTVIFPLHPRTKKKCEELGIWDRLTQLPNLTLTEPLDYFAFQQLIAHAYTVITDSGGIQEETTFRQIPCITLRDNTERPSTIDIGTNILTSRDIPAIVEAIERPKSGNIPPLWDGQSTSRILEAIC